MNNWTNSQRAPVQKAKVMPAPHWAVASGIGCAVRSPALRTFYQRHALKLLCIMLGLHALAVALVLPPFLALHALHWAVGGWWEAAAPPGLLAIASTLSGYLSLAAMLVRYACDGIACGEGRA